MSNNLKGYAFKRAMRLVPHKYPERMKGVYPPVSRAEAKQHQDAALRRRAEENAWRFN